MRFLLILIFTATLLSPTLVFAACGADGKAAAGNVSRDTAGVFMQDICQVCWDEGNCSLNDILTVVANITNFILEIVGVLVFLYYIAGGFYWIISRGDQGLVTKGKKMIRNASIGLAIVLVAYTAVVALRTAITGQMVSTGYVICDGNKDGQLCGPNDSKCSGFSCLNNCESRGGVCADEATVDNLVAENEEDLTCTEGAGCASDSQFCCLPNP